MKSFAFQQQLTWRKLGYLFFTNSLSYREVLEQNRQWNVTELPPVGAQLVIDNTLAGVSNSGLLGTSLTPAVLSGQDNQDSIFPYENVPTYRAAVNRYNLYGVLYRESLNGYCADSPSAITGKQQ